MPDGLKEQIISEHAAKQRTVLRRRKILFALAAIIVVFGALAVFQIPFAKNPAADDTLAVYRHQMIGIALRGYGMDLFTNNPTAVRDYLTQQKAPVDYVLPAALQKVALAGCAIEGWQNAKVSMICFRTGKALPTAAASDLWLFVVDRAAVKDPPPIGPPTLFNANQITAAAWTQGDKVYLLATEGEEAALRSFL